MVLEGLNTMGNVPEQAGEDHAALLGALSGLLAQEKSLSAPIQWVDEGRHLRFSAALEIAEVTEDRLRLHGRAIASMPDRQVSLSLVWLGGPGRGLPFERLEWRPLDEHTNGPMVPRPHRFRRIVTSHRHALDLNVRVAPGLFAAMDQNLPAAEEIDPDPPDWAGFVTFAANVWRIADLADATPPPWQYDLLPLTGGSGRRGRKR
jgi:hypothetical protein